LLDGIDEVPGDRIETFCNDLGSLISDNPDAPLIMTCRQGFYPEVREKMPVGMAEFNLLPFNTEEIAAFVGHAGLNPENFFREMEKSDFGLEASNPFTLGTLISALKLRGELEPLRSGNLRIVVDAVLAERSDLQPQDARRALRLLAVAMEIYTRNALTRQEALRVFQEGMRISSGDAERLLGQLSKYILLITSAGYSFQMRSYGEYLAAEELASAPVDRILNLVLFPGTRRFNRSWANTISYLVEMHEEVRHHLSVHYPDLVLNASPSAFSTADRTHVVESVLKGLAERDSFLIGHQTIAHRGLAGCGKTSISHSRSI
jgi:hypothetical protein